MVGPVGRWGDYTVANSSLSDTVDVLAENM